MKTLFSLMAVMLLAVAQSAPQAASMQEQMQLMHSQMEQMGKTQDPTATPPKK